MIKIGFEFKISEARKLLDQLQDRKYVELSDWFLCQAQVELQKAIDEYDLEQKEEKLRRDIACQVKREHDAAFAECSVKGHESGTPRNAVIVVDGMAFKDMNINVPNCPRCGDAIVQLDDGSWIDWITWKSSGQLLHPLFIANNCEPKLRGTPP